MTTSPLQNTIERLLQSERSYNASLNEIIANARPNRSKVSLTSLIRGLYTKSTKLVSISTTALEGFQAYDTTDDMDLLKAFVNKLLLWFDQDGLVLFEKYCAAAISSDEDPGTIVTAKTRQDLGLPIHNLANYIAFIDEAIKPLRNPFIIEQLQLVKSKLSDLLADYKAHCITHKLNKINFDNIKGFGDTVSPSSKAAIRTTAAKIPTQQSPDRVSSYFKIDQIVERSGTEQVTLLDTKNRQHSVELLLLYLGPFPASPSKSFNALAILECSEDQTHNDFARSLMFPPFRINELSINFEHSEIILKSISFSSFASVKDSKLVISSTNQSFLSQWFKKLVRIFPSELNNTPISDTFLIKPNQGPPPVMSGLGINMVSDVDHKQVYEVNDHDFETPPNSSKSNTFKELVNSPSLSSSSPLSQLQNQFQQPSYRRSGQDIDQKRSSKETVTNDGSPARKTSTQVDPVLPNPPFISDKRKNSYSSMDSGDSIKSQYDRSLHIINKAISNSSGSREAKTNHIKLVNRGEVLETPASDSSDHSLEPCQGELVDVDSSPNVNHGSPYLRNKNDKQVFASAPDLSKAANTSQRKIYQLSGGSAIDLSNFGKSYNPSFSIPKGMSDLAKKEEPEVETKSANKPKRKSFFNLFKKTKTPAKSNSPRLPQSPISVNPNDNDEKNDQSPIDNPFQLKHVEPKPNNPEGEREVQTSGQTGTKRDDLRGSSNSSIKLQPPTDSYNPVDGEKSNLPSPFALPSSTSTYFFKQFKNEVPNPPNSSSQGISSEEDIVIPQDLKDLINKEPSIDFFITPSSPRALKISKWKQKYGKWELITVNESLFIKIVVNYDLNKAWLIVFKEEFDEEYQEEVDVPILLLDIDESSTAIRQSSALDIQLQAVNSLTSEKLLVILRCKTGALVESIFTNITNLLGVMTTAAKNSRYASLLGSKGNPSDATISSSIMDLSKEKPSESSTLSSITSHDDGKTIGQSKLRQEQSSNSLSTQDITNAQIVSNPGNPKYLTFSPAIVRLQKQMESYEKINVLSSWQILSMYTLSIYLISDNFSHKNYYNLILEDTAEDSEVPYYSWLIDEDETADRIETIGKAGLLIKVSDDELFMVECRGKKEFRQLFEVFQ